MAKKRKTKQLKKKSDYRHRVAMPTVQTLSVEPTIPQTQPTRQQFSYASSAPSSTISSTGYTSDHVGHDLKKTALVTGMILLAQISLVFIMNAM